MDDLLEPGESVIYRGKPGWRTAAIAVACGIAFAAAIHLLVGTFDDNWTCPASVMWLAVMSPFGAMLVARTAGARLILTDRRLLYRQGRGADPEQVALADIRSATFCFPEFLPAMRISHRSGEDLTVKYLARMEDLCHRVHSTNGAGPASPHTLRGAILIVAAAFGAALGFWLGMFGTGWLLIQEPTGTINAIQAWHQSGEFADRILAKVSVAAGMLVLIGPIVAVMTIAAWIGYLPALVACRLLISFDEARHLALVPRRMARPFDLSGNSELPEDGDDEQRTGWFFKVAILWPMLWVTLTIIALALLTDRLVRLVFRRAVAADNTAATESHGSEARS